MLRLEVNGTRIALQPAMFACTSTRQYFKDEDSDLAERIPRWERSTSALILGESRPRDPSSTSLLNLTRYRALLFSHGSWWDLDASGDPNSPVARIPDLFSFLI